MTVHLASVLHFCGKEIASCSDVTVWTEQFPACVWFVSYSYTMQASRYASFVDDIIKVLLVRAGITYTGTLSSNTVPACSAS